MRNKRMLLSWLMAGAALCMQAQQTAVKAVADGHYYGARQQFERFLDETDEGVKGREDAEALSLVCDYVLGNPGTADRIGEWTKKHPLSQYADVLRIFRRNLLVKGLHFDEALASFFEDEANGTETPTVLPYPLTGLTDEVFSYNNVLYRLAGEKLYDEGKYDRALGYLEAGEKTRTSQYKQGMCYYRNGQYDKAIATLKEAAGVDQDEMAQNAWLHVGIAALQTSNKAEAQTAFLTAANMNAKSSLREQALYNYALTLHEQNAANTVTVMEQFLNDYPSSQYATPVSQCLTEVYMSKKNYSKALDAINKVQTPDATTLADKQKVLVAMGKADAEAYAESYYVKGDCNYRLGNYAQAASDLQTAITLGQQTPSGKLKNSGYALYSLGYAQFKQQKYNAAITEFKKITELSTATNQVKADAYNRIGDCYLNMRNYDEANANYATAKATDHTMGDYSMLQQAYIEGLRGNYDKKVDIINQMNAEYPASSQAAKALYEQGRAYVLSGKDDEAAAVFSSISIRYPGSEYAKKAGEELANMAANIAIQDSIAAAQDSIATETAKAPVMAAQKLFNAGQYQQAEQQLNKAIDEGIGKPYWLARAFILLSDIYKAEGREVEAKQTLESLRANYKESDDIKSMIDQRSKTCGDGREEDARKDQAC